MAICRLLTLSHSPQLFPAPNCWNSGLSRTRGRPIQTKTSLSATHMHTLIHNSTANPPPCRLLLVTLQHFLFKLGHFLSLSSETGSGFVEVEGEMRRQQGHCFVFLILNLTHTYRHVIHVEGASTHFNSSCMICAPVALKTSYKSHVAHLLKLTSGQNEDLWNCGTHIILNSESWWYKEEKNRLVTGMLLL